MSPQERVASQRRRETGRVLLWIVLVLAAAVALGAGYLSFVLRWSYSEGERAGVVQKFSRKGWLCKTWEGELAMTSVPGVAPVIWNFTVRDDEVVVQVSAALGKPVVLHYTEHPGIPTSCFGETPFFVDRVRLDASPVVDAPDHAMPEM